ncbi:MAG TPA: Gfo/Idh/MocA family oxidoreductase [Thermoguttaceae bacterium]|nr:Gfo/Idh/MocA family oxidoreductase [Thermoguttaceae bacterium]
MTKRNETQTAKLGGRRDFLKASAATVAGLSIARGAHAAGSDVIKIGMVGCGGRCAGAAGNAMTADPSVRLVAMTDIFPDRVQGRLAELKKQMPDQVQVDADHCFSGLDGYKSVIDAVDVVLIACAAKFHPMYLKAGIEAGKHVFVEKPHGIDPAGIKVVKEAAALAKQKNLGVLSGLQSRFHPAYRETVQRVHDGQIGEIISIEENFIRGPYGRTSYPEGASELEAQYGNQYRFSWLCGDDVPQSLVHNMDRATWAMNEDVPVDAHGLGGRSGVQNLLGDVFDHNSVVYRYASGIRVYALCRTTFGCYNESSSIILGSKGIAEPTRGRISGPNEWKYSGPGGNPYVIEHAEFLQSIKAGKPLNCGDYMARSTLVTIMGQLSCYSGKLVTWDQVNQSDYFIPPRAEDCTFDMEPPTKRDENGIYPVCAMPGVTKNI